MSKSPLDNDLLSLEPTANDEDPSRQRNQSRQQDLLSEIESNFSFENLEKEEVENEDFKHKENASSNVKEKSIFFDKFYSKNDNDEDLGTKSVERDVENNDANKSEREEEEEDRKSLVVLEKKYEDKLFYEYTPKEKIAYVLDCVFTIVMFMATNSLLNFGNGYIYSQTGFRYPLLMTGCHALIGGMLGLFYIQIGTCYNPEKCTRLKKITPHKHAFIILLTSLFFALNVALNNASFLYISVTLNQVIRSLNIVFTAIFSVFILKKSYSVLYWIGVVAISISVMFSVYGNPIFNWMGFLLALSSSICAALMVTLIGYLTQKGDDKLDSINTVIWTALPIFAFCMPMFCWGELISLIHYLKEGIGFLQCVVIIGTTGFMAFVYNVFHYHLIAITTAVYSTAVGNFKSVVIFVIVAIWSPSGEKELTVVNWCGFFFTVFLFFYLNWVS